MFGFSEVCCSGQWPRIVSHLQESSNFQIDGEVVIIDDGKCNWGVDQEGCKPYCWLTI